MGLLERSGWWLYEAGMAGGLLCAAPWLMVRRGAHYTETLPGRLGLGEGGQLSGALWIHAVSVGEVAVAATLVRALPEELPLVVTTVTPTGQAQARARFLPDEAPEERPHRAVAYLPFDLSFPVRRFFRRFSPRALVLIEGDYWPRVLREARLRELPVAVVNGRVGETSARRLARMPKLAKHLFFSTVHRFGVQTEQDRQRLIAGGAEASRIHITGNLKYDTPKPESKPELEDSIRQLADGRPILIAGSTMAGEDEAVLDAFRRLGGGERALLLLVPRHPERWDGVARLVEGQGFRLGRRSALEKIAPESALEVLLLDSLGELAALYALADTAFIGGTLAPTGGHNPLEPACFAVPTVVGPSMFNFRDMAQRFDRSGAWSRAADAEELAQVWDGWLRSPEEGRAVGRRAAELLEANRGALGRTVNMLESLLSAVRGGSPVKSPSRPRSPWQLFYGGAHRLRHAWYRKRAQRLPRPVLSVGNLHWGGGGKTPLTAALAAHLRDRSYSVAILSRGYGSRGEGVRLVSRGEGPLLGPGLAGDEPVLLAGLLPGVAVVVCPDRYLAGLHALERLNPAPDLFLLDDGFSHLRLHRDLDLLAFPAADPFAGGRLPPGGLLREPMASSARAHAAVLTGFCDDGLGDELAQALAPHGFTGRGFVAPTRIETPRTVPGGEALTPGSRVLLVSAIARPEGFVAAVEAQGFDIAAHLTWRDHHTYPDESLASIAKTFEESDAVAVLTTSKDRVKLQGRLELPLAELPVCAEPEPAFFQWLDEKVSELVGGQV